MAATELTLKKVLELVEEGEHLDRRDPPLNDENLKEFTSILENNETVTSIDLGLNKLSSDGVKTIIEMLKTTNVKKINFHNSQIQGEYAQVIAEALKSNTTLICIGLTRNAIDDDGVIAIAEALKPNKTLKILDLSHNYAIGDKGAEAIAEMLGKNKTLIGIDLQGTSITRAGEEALTKAPRDGPKIYLADDDGLTLQGPIVMPVSLSTSPHILLKHTPERDEPTNAPLPNLYRPSGSS